LGQPTNTHRFERLIVQGYRRLYDVEVNLRPLTVLIGANGSGKTSFLEVWSLLAASAAGQLHTKISELGGFNDIRTRRGAHSITFNVSWKHRRKSTLRYYLRLEPQSQFYAIGDEWLLPENQTRQRPRGYIEANEKKVEYADLKKGKKLKLDWEYDTGETALSQVPKLLREPEAFRQDLGSCVLYGVMDVSARSPVRLPQTLRPTTRALSASGEDLISCLYNLRETDPDRFEVLEDSLRAAFSDYRGLDFPLVAAGTAALTWRDVNFVEPFFMNQLSEGTVRFLWLATLLLSRNLPAVTLIDEPEVSLHPNLLRFLAELLREAASRTQVIVATQSDGLVRFLKPDEVMVAEVHNGMTSLKWASEMDLEHWLDEFSLADLWHMGRLGERA
jgi:predicted ATPase